MKLRLPAVLILSVGSVLLLSAWLLVLAQAPAGAMSGDPILLSAQKSWNVELVGQLGGPAKGVATQGSLAFVPTGPRLVIVDISDPGNPVQVGSYQMPLGYARDVALAGAYAYIAGGGAGLHIVDVSNAAHPVWVGSSSTGGSAWAVDVADDHAYVADTSPNRMHIIDVSDPTSPTLDSTYTPSIDSTARDVTVAPGPGQTLVYLSCNPNLFVVDVTDPGSPLELGFHPTQAFGLAPVGSVAFVAAASDGLRAIDFSSPGTPILLDTLDTLGSALAVAVSGTHAYVADWSHGLRIVDISAPSALVEDGSYDTPGAAEDVVVTGNHALVADDERGLRIVDVSSPSTPTEEGAYDVTSAAWSVAVSGTLAYVGDYYYIPSSAPGALRIMDISDPANPGQIGFAELSGRGTGLALAGDYAYLSGYAAGLLVADVSNPFSASEVISYPTTKLANDVAVAGDYAYLAENRDLYLFDISDPPAPAVLGTWPAPGNGLSSVAVDGDYAYVGAARDGLRIVDISNPSTPTETGVYPISDHINDVALLGDRAYVAADSEGLHIVDVSNPNAPVQAGLYRDAANLAVDAVAVRQSDLGQTLAYLVGAVWDADEWHHRLSVLNVTDPANPVRLGFHDLVIESYNLVVAEDGSGQAMIYLANSDEGLTIFCFQPRLFLPIVLRNGP